MRIPWISFSVLLALAPPIWAQGLSLEAAQIALPNTSDWKSADLTYEAAQRSLEAAQAASGLKVTGGTNYSLVTPLQPAGSAQSSLNASVAASMGVLPWTASADAIRSASRALDRAAFTRRDTRNSLYINLSSQYFALRQATLAAGVAQATLALRQNQLRVATAQNQAGMATLEQVLTAQQNLDVANSSAVSTAGSLELAKLSLANLLSVDPQSLGQPSTAPLEPALPSESLEALLQKALTNRSDVLKTQSQLQDAQDSLNSAQRDRVIPDSAVSVAYTNGAQGSQTGLSAGLNFKSGNASVSGSLPLVSNSSGTANSSVSLGVSLSLPILDPSADARIASAQTALDLNQAALELVRRAAELDVRQKYQTLQTAKAAIAVAKSASNSADQALRTAQARLQAGTGTGLDVQSAQVNQQQAQANLETALAQAQIAALALQNAIGVNLTGDKP